jgi:DNA polymerase-3 subunit gamma/tau
MVFYRKYRSQTIDELDSSAVREKLLAVLKKDIPHAFLFTGPKGLGKTSTARIVAKAVNCTGKKAGEIEPCNTCEQCLSITNNTSIDTLEIDAASNRGIDEIRDLKEKIRLSPVSSKMKVYIIDEVHMLTTEAFNALLKTLEEPPEHAMFILCTTEPQKLPNTIMSRCFSIVFTPATQEELVRSFKRIAKGEKMDVADDALEFIASLSDKGFRDGAKIFEELSMIANGEKITKELIEEKYQISNAALYITKMVDTFVAKDAKAGLEIVETLVTQGFQMKDFVTKLTEHLHNLMLVKSGVRTSDEKDSGLTIPEITVLFELLTRAYGEMKSAVLPQLPLELVILEWASLRQANKPVKPISSENKADRPAPVAAIAEDVTVSTLRKQVGDMKRKQVLYGEEPKKPIDEIKIETSTVELLHTSGDGPVTSEWLAIFWRALLDEMKKHNHTVAGVLRGCTIRSYAKHEMIIETAYKFHKERLDEMKNRDVLLSICKALTGNEIEIKVELRKN